MFTEQRKSTRRILKTKAALALEGEAPVVCRTSDVGGNGVSLQVPHPVRSGQVVQIMFDLLVDGKIVNINARARVQYCILSQGEFKVGLEFVNLPLAAITALSRYLR